MLYEQAGDIKQYLEAKQLRPVIIFAQKRHPAFPDVPCSVELGYEITLPQFRCIVAKKGVPADQDQNPERCLQKSDGDAGMEKVCR